ncbi:UNVERIFIED_ORG: hypothetical protein GGE64_006261 [Rhizobium etli]|uniref:Ricin B lectin domain-containing protein n=2 Tax=Rhizobium TaxID=379 RepID=A0ABX4JSI8_9HYPH|nr:MULTISPECIES: RICIN domain-containing protein [Rhizobium]ABC92998.1 hypothetical conserved protein [Rhizobium etli CFN 42]MBB4420844.1 hypothetical protein [Rhizobium leguminosarum]PDT21888.1 hypothetical protein CO674_20355 [Rhizobium hidalgonense]PON08549.1 hypothetical protein ATY29_06050 [Rhizobium hidalgonense]ULR42518.1 RICIN domain-containing protein [Rhizobium sp. K102]
MGQYVIEFKQNPDFVLGVDDQKEGAKVVLRKKDSTVYRHALWDLNSDSGAITLNSSAGNLAIGSDRLDPQAQLSLKVYNPTDEKQRWELLKKPGFILSNGDNRLCIDNDARGTSTGNRIWLFQFNGSPAQQWNFVSLSNRLMSTFQEAAE